MNQFLVWLHLFGIVVSLGSGLFFILVFYPSLKSIPEPGQRMKTLAEALKYFHPLFLFGICLVFVSGAIRLTDLKIGFGTLYYSTFGRILLWKFGMTLLIFLAAGMQCFGMGLKLGRMANGVIPGDLPTQERYARKIKRVMTVNLIFLGITLYIGLKLMPIVYGGQ
jgi:uncharacterized membrane protein